MTKTCTLIGILDDGWSGLGETARSRLGAAGCVIGARRTLDLIAPHLAPGTRLLCMDGGLGQVPTWIDKALTDGLTVCVLATGDPLCHGLGGRLVQGVGPSRVEILPALTTLQLAFARLQLPWQGARIASCHGAGAGDWGPEAGPTHPLYGVVQAIAGHPLVGVFTGPDNGPDRIARALLTVGYGEEVRLSVAAHLQLPDEALCPRLTLMEAAGRRFPDPNVLILERAPDQATAAPIFGLPDTAFARQGQDAGDRAGLITKQEVRALSLARLALRRDSLVWDIGAGSGAVGLEASRIAPAGHVWAIERSPARAADARENARRLRAGNFSLHLAEAPAGLTGWPDPDAVFIGGSGGALGDLIRLVARRLRPHGRLVLNLVTLENLHTATAALEGTGLGWDLIQLGAVRSQPIRTPQGTLHRLAALNPVWVLTATQEPH